MSTSSYNIICFHDSGNGKYRKLSQKASYILLKYFDQNARPNTDEIIELSSVLGINSKKIKYWFQNRRVKLRKEFNNPNLFSKKSTKELKSEISFPQVTAKNFKELCLPKYLDIPIKGQILSNEDIANNDAIKRFWQKQQETTNEGEDKEKIN